MRIACLLEGDSRGKKELQVLALAQHWFNFRTPKFAAC